MNEINHTERAHAKIGFSPSGLSKGMNCTRSILLERQVPQSETEYTKRGTELHEICDAVGLKAQAGDPDPQAGLTDPEGIIVSGVFLELRAKYIKAIGEENIVAEHFEKRVELTEHIWGSADWVLVYKVDGQIRAIVFDHKFGRIPVSPESNTQLITYALAVREEHEWEQASLVIFQPFSNELEEVKQWVLTKEQALKERKKIIAYQDKALKIIETGKGARAKVGSHCQWCRGKVLCKSYINDLEEKALMILEEAPPMKEVVKGEKTKLLPDPEAISEGQRVAIINNMDAINSFMKAVQAYEIEMQKQGRGSEKFKLVSGRASRKWKIDHEHVAGLLVANGIREPWNKKIKPIGEVETEMLENFKAPGAKTLKAKKEIIKEQLAPLTEMSEPAPKLVGKDDKRKALKIEKAIDLIDTM